jgi:cytoskeletal protein RodZ
MEILIVILVIVLAVGYIFMRKHRINLQAQEAAALSAGMAASDTTDTASDTTSSVSSSSDSSSSSSSSD